jgi:hypothetical protein
MGYSYPEKVVWEFIDDYEAEWGVVLPFRDAILILSLFDGLTALLEKYDADIGSLESRSAPFCRASRPTARFAFPSGPHVDSSIPARG